MAAVLQQLPAFGMSLFRLCVWLVLLAAIFTPLERLFAGRPRPVLRARLGSDLVYYFLNNLLPPLILAPPLAAIGWLLHFIVPHSVYALSGSLPVWARVGLGLVLGDLAYYWGHRAMHRIPLLWRFHAVHHAAEDVDWLVSTRAHPLDIALSHLCGLIPLYAFGLAQPLSRSTDVAALLFVVIGTAWGFFIHANLNWRFGWLERLVSTPAFHHWHHTRADHVDRNFASLLPGLDLAFGTYYLPRRLPAEYGVRDPIASDMASQLIEPFGPPRAARQAG